MYSDPAELYLVLIGLGHLRMAGNREPQIIKRNGVTVIALGSGFDNLDEAASERLRDPILTATANADPPLVVIDMLHTEFFGSSFIEVLFRVWNRMNAIDGGDFAISGLSSYCKEVLQVTHLDELWKIYDSCDDAVKALTNA